MIRRATTVLFMWLVSVALSSCVQVDPAIDTGDAGVAVSSPTGPSPPTTPLAYTTHIAPVFAADCVVCHGTGRVDGNFRANSYAQVMRAVIPGNAASVLVRVTQQNGGMYRYFSGNAAARQSKAATVRTWVVTYNAQENAP